MNSNYKEQRRIEQRKCATREVNDNEYSDDTGKGDIMGYVTKVSSYTSSSCTIRKFPLRQQVRSQVLRIRPVHANESRISQGEDNKK